MTPSGICSSPPVTPPGQTGRRRRGQPTAWADRRHPMAAVAPGRSRVTAIAKGVAASAILAGSVAAVYAERGMVRTGMAAAWHARPGWVAAGIVLECLSMAGFVLLQRRLLTAAGGSLDRARCRCRYGSRG